MAQNQSPKKPAVKRKKRRLKKQVRYAILGASALVVLLAAFFLIKGIGSLLFSPPEIKPSEDILNPTTYPVMNMEKVTLLLDPGHGGFDGGNVQGANGEYEEKEINLKIALKVKEKLEEINPNIEVILTRDSDELNWEEDVLSDLQAREDLQNSTGADLFLSLHCNSSDDPTVQGYAFFYRDVDIPASELVQELDENFEEIGWSQLHSFNTNELLQVVTNARIPSILLEMAFMTNSDDLNFLLSEEETDKLATAIAGTYSDYIMAHVDEIKESHTTLNAWVDQQMEKAAQAEKEAQERIAQQQKEAEEAARLAEEQAKQQAEQAAKEQQKNEENNNQAKQDDNSTNTNNDSQSSSQT